MKKEMPCESRMIMAMVCGYQNSLWFRSFISLLCSIADSMDDDGTVVDRGPRGSGSLVVSLDALINIISKILSI